MNDRQLKELILAAMGKLPFDIYFYNARIVDVYRERIIDSGSVGIKTALSPQFALTLSLEQQSLLIAEECILRLLLSTLICT